MKTKTSILSALGCVVIWADLIYGLHTAPACSPVPLNVNATASSVTLNWQGDGFRL